MKPTYRFILEKINGRTKEFTLVLDKKIIKKYPKGFAHGLESQPTVKPKGKRTS